MKIELRELSTADLSNLQQWSTLGDASSFMSRVAPKSFVNGRWNLDLTLWWMIAADLIEVGTVWLERTQADEQSADLGILIGATDYRNRGIGKTAIGIAIAQGTAKWRLNEIRLRVRETNLRAIRCYESVGFVAERTNEKILADGSRIKVLEMSYRI